MNRLALCPACGLPVSTDPKVAYPSPDRSQWFHPRCCGSVLLRKMGPLEASHPAVGETCRVCERPIESGAVVTLLPCGAPEEDRRFVACDVVHWPCGAAVALGIPAYAEAGEAAWG
jgi:hypothetical protein